MACGMYLTKATVYALANNQVMMIVMLTVHSMELCAQELVRTISSSGQSVLSCHGRY